MTRASKKTATAEQASAPARAEVHAEHGLPTPGDIMIGQWYWLRVTDTDLEHWDEKDGIEQGLVPRPDNGRKLVCVTDLGSNYAELTHVNQATRRVHFGHFAAHCVLEEDPDSIISDHVRAAQREVQSTLGEIKALMQQLGIDLAGRGESTALARLSGHVDPKAHSAALAKARDEDLPALHAQMKKSNERMVMWLGARAIPFAAMAGDLRETVKTINDRVFNIELYAGLVETVKLIRDGEPAPLGTKLAILQRMHFMDEECLIDYKAGGLVFEQVGDFDDWLCKPENFERLLPHPRCILAFRVRRYPKEATSARMTMQQWVQFKDEAEKSMYTYLYIRNGERLYWLGTKIEFDVKLFPDRDRTHNFGSQKLYIHERTSEVITEGRYRELVKDFRAAEKKYREKKKQYEIGSGAWDLLWKPQLEQYERDHAAWVAALGPEDKKCYHDFGRLMQHDDEPKEPEHPSRPWSPHFYDRHPCNDYAPFDRGTVHYDDATKKIEGEVQEHNRLALLVQGLFDRSDVLHPHAPTKLWDAQGFEEAVDLIYDVTRAVTNGPAPSFEAYCARTNASIVAGSHVLGQRRLWGEEMAEIENAHRRRRGDSRSEDLDIYYPRGNPGPANIDQIVSIRGGLARFEWQRENDRYRRSGGKIVDCHFSCPVSGLFHVDAYVPGDFRQFFDDPRTRADYLTWAPVLLAAEDWHGARKKKDPRTQRRPMTLCQLTKRQQDDLVHLRIEKSGKVREEIRQIRRVSVDGPPAERRGYIIPDEYTIMFRDGSKVSFHRRKIAMDKNLVEDDGATYTFGWLTIAENAARKATAKAASKTRGAKR